MVPGRPLLVVLALLIALAAVAAAVDILRPAALAVATGVLGVALLDAVLGLRRHVLAARRLLPGSLPLGVASRVTVRVSNGGPRARRVTVHDHHPGLFEATGLPLTVTVPPDGWAEAHYEVRPVRRGEHHFGPIAARLASPLGLWERQVRLGEPSAVRVYPNFAAVTKYALFATDHRLSQLGILQRRRRGEGLEFHQLRDYREGDSLRQIDWKATSRSPRLISREYQDERDQQIVFLIDCGRRLAAQDGELSHFDHVLNAALLMSYVALREGDAVGFMTMSGERQFMAPRKSAATVNEILNRLYDVQPSLMTTDYYSAALDLARRLRKRALVVILSNMRDEDDDTLAPALALLAKRHLVLFASLREGILGRALRTRVDGFDPALTYAATADYLAQRELAFRRIGRGGAICLDVEPDALPVALVNRYLDIKRSGRL